MNKQTLTLHPYQERGLQHILDNPGAGCFWDMGLGKTLTTLTALTQMKAAMVFKKVLIVAPKRVAVHTWPSEIAKWGFDLTYSVIAGTPGQRQRKAQADVDICLINYENLVWLIKLYGRNWPYDVVVFDESSKMKDPGTKRFRAFKRAMPYVERTILLTGTPSANSLLNLWSQVYLLDQGERLGKTYTAYKNRFFDSDFMGYTFTPKYNSEREIQGEINDVCLSMEALDHLDVPAVTHNTVEVFLSTTQLVRYGLLEVQMYLMLEENSVEAANAAVLTSKCLQYANGAVYVTDEMGDSTGEWEVLHDLKLDALEEIIDGNPGQPLLVFYNFKSDLARILKRFPQGQTIDKDGAILDDWNASKIPLLVAHPASAGHGLNMQDGGHIAVWFGLTWSLENYMQANARLHRQGQTKPVVIHHIITRDTVDELVMQRLVEKKSSQDILMQALKRRTS